MASSSLVKSEKNVLHESRKELLSTATLNCNFPRRVVRRCVFVPLAAESFSPSILLCHNLHTRSRFHEKKANFSLPHRETHRARVLIWKRRLTHSQKFFRQQSENSFFSCWQRVFISPNNKNINSLSSSESCRYIIFTEGPVGIRMC